MRLWQYVDAPLGEDVSEVKVVPGTLPKKSSGAESASSLLEQLLGGLNDEK